MSRPPSDSVSVSRPTSIIPSVDVIQYSLYPYFRDVDALRLRRVNRAWYQQSNNLYTFKDDWPWNIICDHRDSPAFKLIRRCRFNSRDDNAKTFSLADVSALQRFTHIRLGEHDNCSVLTAITQKTQWPQTRVELTSLTHLTIAFTALDAVRLLNALPQTLEYLSLCANVSDPACVPALPRGLRCLIVHSSMSISHPQHFPPKLTQMYFCSGRIQFLHTSAAALPKAIEILFIPNSPHATIRTAIGALRTDDRILHLTAMKTVNDCLNSDPQQSIIELIKTIDAFKLIFQRFSPEDGEQSHQRVIRKQVFAFYRSVLLSITTEQQFSRFIDAGALAFILQIKNRRLNYAHLVATFSSLIRNNKFHETLNTTQNIHTLMSTLEFCSPSSTCVIRKYTALYTIIRKIITDNASRQLALTARILTHCHRLLLSSQTSEKTRSVIILILSHIVHIPPTMTLDNIHSHGFHINEVIRLLLNPNQMQLRNITKCHAQFAFT